MQSWNTAAPPTTCRRQSRWALCTVTASGADCPAASPFLYQPLTHGHQRKHSKPSLLQKTPEIVVVHHFTTSLCTANPGLHFFSCGTARKTQVTFELSKKANTDFHSPENSTLQRVIWVFLEKNILSLTDGMAETVLRMKSMKNYWTLIFNCISTTSIQQWLPSYSDVFLIFLSNLTRHWDPAGFGSSSCSSYDA